VTKSYVKNRRDRRVGGSVIGNGRWILSEVAVLPTAPKNLRGLPVASHERGNGADLRATVHRPRPFSHRFRLP